MKPIETIYNGYRFRSRLEARYAVFFDTLGIKWEYEKEGYDLNGTWYLPDFWLPIQQRWIEVKGRPSTEEERLKAKLLFEQTGYPVFITQPSFSQGCTPNHPLDGLPDHGMDGYYTRVCLDGTVYRFNHDIGWRICPACGTPDILMGLEDDQVINEREGGRSVLSCTCYRLGWGTDPRCRGKDCPYCWGNGCGIIVDGRDSPRLIAAYTAARQARFEQK